MVKNGRSGSSSGRAPRLPRKPNKNVYFGKDGQRWDIPSPTSDIGMAPAPLLGPRDLILIGLGLLIGQLWGYFNQRGRIEGPEREDVTVNFPGGATVSITSQSTDQAYSEYSCVNSAVWSRAAYGNTPGTVTFANIGSVVFRQMKADSTVGPCGSGAGTPVSLGWNMYDVNGVWKTGYTFSVSVGSRRSDWRTSQKEAKVVISQFTANGKDERRAPSTPDPFRLPPAFAPVAPELEPEALPAAPPVPSTPFAPPAIPPAVEPMAPPLPFSPGSPSPGGVPSPVSVPLPRPVPNRPPAPIASPVPAPAPVPNPVPQPGPDGVPVPVPVPQPPVTPPDVEQTPDGPVGGGGSPPPPTLPGIAAEVGKIEQKILKLMQRPQVGTDLTDLLQLLATILGWLNGVHEGGSYEIQGPCDFDSNGDPLDPLTASYAGGIGLESLISNRLDAIAELIQHHKTQRQPVCRASKGLGEPVTVLFQQQP